MTPQGHLNSICRLLKRHAQSGNVTRFQAFIASDEFAQAMVDVGPRLRQNLLRMYAEYAGECDARAHLPPPVKSRRMGDGPKCNWRDPALRAKLARVYAICGDDHEKAGRMMRITTGAARLAKKRNLTAAPMSMAA